MTSPAMDAALGLSFVPDFVAVEVQLPFYTLRLIDGASQLDMPVPDLLTGVEVMATFRGEDPTYGTMGGMDATTEGLGTSAPTMRMVVRCPTLAAAAQLNLPTNQDANVRMWYGVLNAETGAVVGVDLLFWGWLNQPRFASAANQRDVEMDISSAMELLFSNEEGQRLNHQTLTKAFPGARGCEYVSDIERALPWGSDAARSPLISAAGGGYYGGGGGFAPGGGGGGGSGLASAINGGIGGIAAWARAQSV